MRLFDKRPLSLILCVMLGGFVVFSFIDPVLRPLPLLFIPLLILLPIILKFSKSKRWLCFLCAIFLAICAIASYLYFDLYFFIDRRFEGEVKISGEVIEAEKTTESTTRLLVKTDSIENSPFSSYKLSVYVSSEEHTAITTGDKLELTGELVPFDEDIKAYYYSKGISAELSSIKEINIMEKSNGTTIDFSYLRDLLTRHAIFLSDYETGSMVSALLIGERDYLSSQTQLDFKRIGISHVLALSGMHLAILTLAIGKLLSLFGVNKRLRFLISSIFVFLYMAFTGFSVSVVRAGIMLIIYFLLFLCMRGRDSVTSLFIAVFIICLITPYAIFDASLWLSAFATLGVIMAGEYMSMKKEADYKKNSFIRNIKAGLLSSVFAISATLAITVFIFGGISYAGPLTTIIFSFLAEIIMYLGSLMLLLGSLIPIGRLLAPICSFTATLAGKISSLDFCYASVNYDAVKISVVLFSLIFFLLLIINVKSRRVLGALILSSFFGVYLFSGIFSFINKRSEQLVYLGEDRCDSIFLKSDGEFCLINSSEYSKNTAFYILENLEELNVSDLDAYYLTHLSWRLSDDISVMLERLTIDRIYLPLPRNDEERIIYKNIEATVREYRTEIIPHTVGGRTGFGGFTLSLLYSTPYGEDSSTNALCITSGEERFVYLSSGMLDGRLLSVSLPEIEDADAVIFGAHGKRYSSREYLDVSSPKIKKLILASDNLFLMQDNMRFYTENGCEIYSHPSESVIIFK